MTSILTGDIINSKSTSSKEWLPAIKKVFEIYGKEPEKWEIFRGDSFQMEVNPLDSFVAALQLKTIIKTHKHLNVRIAIGIGDKTYHSRKITEANGSAFSHSGECFDKLRNTLAVKTPWPEFDEEVNLYFELALLTIDGWNSNTSNVLSYFFKYPELNQKEIAKKLKRAPSTINETLKRAGYDEIMKLEKRYKYLLSQK